MVGQVDKTFCLLHNECECVFAHSFKSVVLKLVCDIIPFCSQGRFWRARGWTNQQGQYGRGAKQQKGGDNA